MKPSLFLACLFGLLLGCGGEQGPQQPTVGFVTNSVNSFWVLADRGANAAATEFDVNVEVMMPPDGVAGQKRMVQDLLARGVDGIAISPSDPKNQPDLLAEIAANTTLITHDSDAPDSERLVYIGMNNYDAGRMCGQLLKKAMPDGGEVIILVGALGQLNADLRRQGVIDELLDRSHDPARRDPVDEAVAGEKYTVLATYTDGYDYARAKAQAEDALVRYPNLDAMIGLFVYNAPQALEAVRDAGKVGQVTIVAFDEADDTLRAIQEGSMAGTIVQNPYQYGYESVRVLAALVRGDRSVLPESQFIDIPAREINADNVDAFWTELKTVLSTASVEEGP